MQLETKPRIYYRLSLLISKSNAFRQEVDNYNNEFRECRKNGFVPKDLTQKAVEKINTEFSIGVTDDEKGVALKAIEDYLRVGLDQKIGHDFRNGEIVLRIKAPITRKEFEEWWENDVKELQLRFLQGYENKNFDVYYENLQKSKLKKLGASKGRKSMKKRYSELEKKRWKTIQNIVSTKKHGDSHLSTSEAEEFGRLRKIFDSMDIFKYPSGIENIDEDLLVLRLYKKHEDSRTVANEEYKKLKLSEYLKNRDGKDYKFTRIDKFNDLVGKYITEKEMKKHHAKNTGSLIRAKNFDTRLRAIKEVYML